jgi:hypothetical protein
MRPWRSQSITEYGIHPQQVSGFISFRRRLILVTSAEDITPISLNGGYKINTKQYAICEYIYLYNIKTERQSMAVYRIWFQSMEARE